MRWLNRPLFRLFRIPASTAVRRLCSARWGWNLPRHVESLEERALLSATAGGDLGLPLVAEVSTEQAGGRHAHRDQSPASAKRDLKELSREHGAKKGVPNYSGEYNLTNLTNPDENLLDGDVIIQQKNKKGEIEVTFFTEVGNKVTWKFKIKKHSPNVIEYGKSSTTDGETVAVTIVIVFDPSDDFELTHTENNLTSGAESSTTYAGTLKGS